MPTFWAAHPGEPVFEIATLQKLLDCRVDDPPPETITFLVTLQIDSLELWIETFDQSIKRRLFRQGGSYLESKGVETEKLTPMLYNRL